MVTVLELNKIKRINFCRAKGQVVLHAYPMLENETSQESFCGLKMPNHHETVEITDNDFICVNCEHCFDRWLDAVRKPT